ncbi:MAG TPA: hypothetical protein VJ476_11285 [Rhizomicrobium sp.]|nr:hypothetical protein [Rhizomicrobium sp.]
MLRTQREVICKFHSDLPDDIVLRLEELAQRKRGRPAHWQKEYGDYLNLFAASGLGVTAMRAGPLYDVPAGLLASGTSTSIDDTNAEFLHGGLEEWLPVVAAGVPLFAAIEGDHAVAVCATVNASRRAHSAGVETVPAYRGRGFAGRAVAGWANAVRALGCTPFYATTFDNISSQLVARRLNLSPVGSEFSLFC